VKVDSSRRSPNFSDLPINVEFVVLHYTALSLEATLGRFMDPSTECSAHLVIDQGGGVHELVPCMDGRALRAWHAGRSRLLVDGGAEGRLLEGFNDRSIGIELVNLNGNLFKYTDQQYAALFGVVESLKRLYPALKSSEAVVGHEQIAGFRGKADPGRCFEWDRLFAVCYPGGGAPSRQFRCSAELAALLRDFCATCGVVEEGEGVVIPTGFPPAFFQGLSSLLEGMLASS
jgi:N-acetylmuramoyl-L-alanine amidase